MIDTLSASRKVKRKKENQLLLRFSFFTPPLPLFLSRWFLLLNCFGFVVVCIGRITYMYVNAYATANGNNSLIELRQDIEIPRV